MISDKMKKLVDQNSVIRAMFEEGKKLEKQFGKENVYDFSLGSPSVPVSDKIKDVINKILDEENPKTLHGYMNNAGFEDVREVVSKSINNRFNTNFSSKNIIMTTGAASALNLILKSIVNEGEEILTFAPYFVEYKNYVENYNGVLTTVNTIKPTFMPDLEDLKNKITKNTRGLIINSPNNPTGVIYSSEVIEEISKILNEKQKELGTQIFLISDEPYRELVYDNIEVPYVSKYYNNTFVIYSYSKSLSIPGQRIGYIVVPNEMEDFENIISAIVIANRVIGNVNAPSLSQKIIMYMADDFVDIETYKINRDLLYNELTKMGYECISPNGAFYLFLKTPIEDDKQFTELAKKYNILVVPGSSFGQSGYVRIAYCVDTEVIKRALPSFEKLISEMK